MSESELIDSAVKGDNESFDKLIENALIYCKPFILKKFSDLMPWKNTLVKNINLSS